jgi:hypothetical protein
MDEKEVLVTVDQKNSDGWGISFVLLAWPRRVFFSLVEVSHR